MKTGEIYWVNLNPAIGDEIKKKRPVVILNPGHKRHLRLSIALPITAWKPHLGSNPFFVTLEPGPANGLEKRSAVDCYQIRAISHRRFVGRVGSVSETDLGEMKKAVALILDIDPEDCE